VRWLGDLITIESYTSCKNTYSLKTNAYTVIAKSPETKLKPYKQETHMEHQKNSENPEKINEK